MKVLVDLCTVVGLASFASVVYWNTSAAHSPYRDDYNRSAVFAPEFLRRLNAPPLVNVSVVDLMECSLECLSHELCLSFNFAVKQDVNGGGYMCQLLATDKNSAAFKLKPSGDFHFYGVQPPVNEMQLSRSCENGGVHQNGKCKCTEGFKGSACEGCEEGWHTFRGSCYKLSSDRQTWPTAKNSCEELNASLVTIKSAEENEFVKTNFMFSPKRSIWIGLSDVETEGNWTWVDGSPMAYSNWMAQEPMGNEAENCAVIGKGQLWSNGPIFDGHWNDVSCEKFDKKYVCEIGLP